MFRNISKMSLLHLLLESSDGVVNLDKSLEKATQMKLVKYAIRWTNAAASAVGTELINVKIFDESILSTFINTNKTINKNYIPLANNVAVESTIQDMEIVFDVKNQMRNQFKYELRNKTGGTLANLVSLQLWFEYF